MLKTIPFPGPADRSFIHNSIQLYAKGRWTRQQMMTAVAKALNLFGVKKLPVNNYTVKLDVSVATSIGTFSAVTIEAPKGTYKHCPACTHNGRRYISGEAPVITVWCMNCSCIYRKEVKHEKTCKGSRSMDLG